MDTIKKETTEKLHDLILLNNDRFQGYQKAVDQAKQEDLGQLFTRLSAESDKFSKELKALIPPAEDRPEPGETTNSGKLYRVWMDIKSALTTNDRKSVLSACEYGEDVIKKAYEETLTDRDELSADVLAVIQRQYDSLLEAHNRVKALRDAAK